ncbi:polysaccharide deacetylase family sporulation protein PdaB [Gracilibacillus sp. YIM 98692]|uniref:polysaccharide deacetylase family sporulation protein PdaB n=1 Tax=Gracilibacillus sp. YIM 98692 TaxID=2663532 RepID=UPI0013D7D973|nr:polysaccharide deacetylase family sporulation protein PdaB [Gracilibacillus sp. YIM 98692]
MKQLYIIDIKKEKKLFLLVPIAFFVALFLFLETNYTPTVFSNQDAPKALSAGDSEHSSISLTFNIHYGNEKLDPILEELRQNDVRATFFLSGEWAERHPDLLEKIAEDKHEIGMLGYQYKSYVEQDTEAIRRDMLKAKDTFRKLGFEDVYLLRPPNGHINKDVLSIAENQGFKVIHWSINPNDWENPGTDVIKEHVLSNASNGDIVLLHASDAVKQTDKALSTIIPEIKQRGMELTTISEMITQAESKQEELTN